MAISTPIYSYNRALVGAFFFLIIPYGVASDIVCKSEWDIAPKWRERGDCAVNSLFMLLKIEGKNVRLEDLKNSIEIDPDYGSSFNALKDVAMLYGLELEIRFVKPNDLSRLKGPYIIHGTTSHEKNIGHCLVVIGYDKSLRNFTIIDPILGKYESKREAVVKQGFSGYVLIPRFSSARFWDRLAGFSFIFTGLILLGMLLHYVRIYDRLRQVMVLLSKRK
ncbi:MAG: hypothetical protein LBJ00_16850 [Planctomycetaceae bacterium]|jgi:ABC-type bacteriocin/lantibiotic exporter with double-glycine peptidase domain|nr:hypothetical protein [Planctomycetaceae bacterium]